MQIVLWTILNIYLWISTLNFVGGRWLIGLQKLLTVISMIIEVKGKWITFFMFVSKFWYCLNVLLVFFPFYHKCFPVVTSFRWFYPPQQACVFQIPLILFIVFLSIIFNESVIMLSIFDWWFRFWDFEIQMSILKFHLINPMKLGKRLLCAL